MLIIILDILADTHVFEGDFVHKFAIGRHAGEVSSLKQALYLNIQNH